MRRSNWVILAVLATALLLLAGRALTALFVNHAWFAALNAEPVFREQIIDTVWLRGGLAVAGSLFAFLNLYAVRRTILAIAVPSRVGNVEFTAMLPTRRLIAYTIIASIMVGLLLATPFDDWTQLAMARHGMPFGERELYFERDLGHYVYWLPLEQTYYVWALLSTVVMVAIVIVLYALTRSLKVDGKRIVASTHARRHLTVLGSLMLMLLAWSYRLDGYDLLRFGTGNDGLFLRVDHLMAVDFDFALSILTIFSAMLLLRAGWAGQFRMATITLTVVLAAAIGVRHGLPIVLSRSSWLGEPSRRDDDYIRARALFTRRAYDVDGMPVIASDTSRARTGLQLVDLPRVLSVWDAAPLARSLGANASGRVAVSPIVWSPRDGQLKGLLLQKPSAGDGPWTLSRVLANVADDRGAPIHDGIDLGGEVDSASITMSDDVSAGVIGAPVIAPGATGHLLIVDSTTRVVGARLATEGSRIAHAWATRDPRLVSSDEMGAIPTLVMWRDVRERVRKLAPIFAQGQDVIPIVNEGALMWAIELYSASDMYPLAQRWQLAGETRSYFRHAGTAIVHSRTGRVRIVTVDNPDPVARTWMAIAPDLFVKVSALAAELREQLPPPTDGTIAQTRAFSRYGSRLNGSEARHLPDSILGNDPPPGILFELNGLSSAWTIPVLNGPEQIAGIVASVGGASRGSVWMPVASLATRWGVIREQLRATLDSSRQQLTGDAGRREPQTSLGRVRAVIVNGVPAAVQPLYVTRLNQSQALARVAVGYDGKVGVGATLDEAVRHLVGTSSRDGSNGAQGSNVPLSAASRQAAMARLYDSMRAASRRGDWARFGSAFDSLGALLGRPPQ